MADYKHYSKKTFEEMNSEEKQAMSLDADQYVNLVLGRTNGQHALRHMIVLKLKEACLQEYEQYLARQDQLYYREKEYNDDNE